MELDFNPTLVPPPPPTQKKKKIPLKPLKNQKKIMKLDFQFGKSGINMQSFVEFIV